MEIDLEENSGVIKQLSGHSIPDGDENAALDLPHAATNAASGTQMRVAKNAIIYSAAQIVGWFVTLIHILIVPRVLGAEGMGRYTLVANLFSPLVFILFGLEQYLVKEVGRDHANAKPLLSAALGLRLVLSPLYFGMTLIILYLLHSSREIWVMGMLYSLVGVGMLIGDPLRAVLAGWEDAKKVALIDLVIGSSLLLALPFLRCGPVSLCWAIFVTSYATIIMRYVWMRKFISFTFQPRIWRSLLMGGLPFIVNIWLLQMYSFTGVVILHHYANESALGVWGTAQKLYTPFMTISTVIGYALLPALARLAHHDMAEFRVIQSRVLSLLIIIGLPVSTGVILLAPSLCHALYPGQYPGLALTLQLLSLATIPVYIVSTMYQFLIAQNRNAIWSVFLTGTVILYSISNAALIPFTLHRFHNASAGVAISLAIAETCSSIAALVLLRSNPFSWELARRVGGAVVASAAMGGVIWWAGMIPASGGRLGEGIRVVCLAAAGTVVFLVCAWRLRILTEEEQNKLVDLVRRKLLRRS